MGPLYSIPLPLPCLLSTNGCGPCLTRKGGREGGIDIYTPTHQNLDRTNCFLFGCTNGFTCFSKKDLAHTLHLLRCRLSSQLLGHALVGERSAGIKFHEAARYITWGRIRSAQGQARGVEIWQNKEAVRRSS